jgi:hypothetical protein
VDARTVPRRQRPAGAWAGCAQYKPHRSPADGQCVTTGNGDSLPLGPPGDAERRIFARKELEDPELRSTQIPNSVLAMITLLVTGQVVPKLPYSRPSVLNIQFARPLAVVRHRISSVINSPCRPRQGSASKARPAGSPTYPLEESVSGLRAGNVMGYAAAARRFPDDTQKAAAGQGWCVGNRCRWPPPWFVWGPRRTHCDSPPLLTKR